MLDPSFLAGVSAVGGGYPSFFFFLFLPSFTQGCSGEGTVSQTSVRKVGEGRGLGDMNLRKQGGDFACLLAL